MAEATSVRGNKSESGTRLIGMSTAAMFQESNDQWRRLRLQQILYKSVLNNDLDMVLKCVQHGADIREEYLPVSDMLMLWVQRFRPSGDGK